MGRVAKIALDRTRSECVCEGEAGAREEGEYEGRSEGIVGSAGRVLVGDAENLLGDPGACEGIVGEER